MLKDGYFDILIFIYKKYTDNMVKFGLNLPLYLYIIIQIKILQKPLVYSLNSFLLGQL